MSSQSLKVAAAIVCLACGLQFSPADVWDATSLDTRGENTSLAGEWDFVAWNSLDTIPSFNGAEKDHVPRAQRAGAYRTRFTRGKPDPLLRTFLHFGAVAFRCAVFVNGKEIGHHEGGMTPFSFDVTDTLKEGANELVVLVSGARGVSAFEAASAGAPQFNERSQALPGQGEPTMLGGGMFPGDGIRQEVFLRDVPLVHLADVTMVPSFRKKTLTAQFAVENRTPQNARLTARLDILPYDIPKKTMGDTPVWSQSETFLAGMGSATRQISRPWPSPLLWMPGRPHLYVARLRLLGESGKLLHERHIRFGFREVWTEGRKLMINGLPFRAFAHGTLEAEGSPETIRNLLTGVQAVGINLVRPHTRPPVPHFAQIADELGIGLIGESEYCFNPNFAYENPAFWRHFEQTFRERIARDKNHPSILIWSLANEVIICSPGARIGHRFYEAFENLRQLDPTRPFMQEGDGDLRDMREDAVGHPIDIINLHPYDISPRKNPLWSTEFPPVAWALENPKTPADLPAANKFGAALPDRTRPWFMGEFGVAVIGYPDYLSFWTGPSAYRNLFADAGGVVRAIGEITEIQMQAFRDLDMAGMDPWDMPDREALAPFLRRCTEPVTTFTRERLNHGFAGESASRTIITLNDSFETQKLTLTLRIKNGEAVIARKTESFTLPPGGRQDTPWTPRLPGVSGKTSLRFVAELTDNTGKRLSGFQQDWMVYPKIPPSAGWKNGQVQICGDSGRLTQIARWAGVRIDPPSALAGHAKTQPDLVILDGPTEAGLETKARLALERFVEAGGTVMVFGAEKPFGGALVADPDSSATRLFLLQKSPLTAGMSDQDWEFWRPGYLVSSSNYTLVADAEIEYPLVSGGRNGLTYAPLAIKRQGRGAWIASRLEIEPAIEDEPAAGIFLNNVAAYAETLRKSPPDPPPPLTLWTAPEKVSAWKDTMAALKIPSLPDRERALDPAKDIVFLAGDFAPTPTQLERLEIFVRAGGTAWVHRLTPDTSFRDTLSRWVGTSLELRPPKMWLQQLETSPAASPLLNGINDFFTCWAAFCWTNGDMNSVRTTPIVDYVISSPGSQGQSLLDEPPWVGRWNFSPSGPLVTQAILMEIGSHTRNENPGSGLSVFPVGDGRIVIDQLRWNTVMFDPASESLQKAKYLAGQLWKNIASGHRPPAGLPPEK